MATKKEKEDKIELNVEQSKHLDFYKAEIQEAATKVRVLQETAGKYIAHCAKDLGVPGGFDFQRVGWKFNENDNVFEIMKPKAKEETKDG